MSNAIEIENLSKQYRLGLVDASTIAEDLKRWSYKLRGKEDPFLKVGERNVRSEQGGDFVWALKSLSLEVPKGQVLGIIGKNGAGKSTLLKLLSQITEPSTGEVRMRGRVASLLEVGTGFHQELTGRENIFLNGAILGMTKPEIREKLDEIIAFSGVERYIDTPVKRYSSGMKVRLGFAVAAHLEPEILIVDEVLAVGDADFQKKCLGKMKDVSRSGRTILFVSHNMGSIAELCDRAVLLEDGMLVYDDTPVKTIERYLHSGGNSASFYEADNDSELPLKVTHVAIESNGKPAPNADITEPIQICLTIAINENLEEVRLNVMLYKELSMLFHSRISDNLPECVTLEKGTYTWTMEIPGLSLTAGSYSLDVVATYKGGVSGEQHREVLERVTHFELDEKRLNVLELGYAAKRGGLMVAPGEWKLKP